MIDFIEYSKLHYYANKPSRAVFNWKLEYTLIPRLPTPKEEELEPFHTPLMNGGIFAMHKKYFEEIGPYDEGHKVYGAENIDMSLRIWLCGGEIFEVTLSYCIFQSLPLFVSILSRYHVSNNLLGSLLQNGTRI